MNESPFRLVTLLRTHVLELLGRFDMFDFEMAERKLLTSIKHDLADARLDIRDYELSETRVEQLGKAKAAKQRLEVIRQEILSASEYNIFSAIDVAQLTAQLETIKTKLL